MSAFLRSLGPLVCVLSWSTSAFAEFNQSTGTVLLDGVLGQAFEDPNALSDALWLDSQFNPALLPGSALVNGPDRSIEGTGSLELGRDIVFGLVPVEFSRQALLEFRVWVKPEGIMPQVALIYSDGPIQNVGQEVFFSPEAQVFFLPSGRATDDGWVELTTGPVQSVMSADWRVRGLRITDPRIYEQSFFGFSSNTDGTALVDALDVRELGPPVVQDVACQLTNEIAVCGQAGACFHGRCVHASAVVRNLPYNDRIRAEYVDRLSNRMFYTVGGRVSQANLPSFNAAMVLLRDPGVRPADASAVFDRAYDDLADGHISPPFQKLSFGGGGAAACIYLGEADLLPGPSADLPLVYEVDPIHPLARALQRGDVITRVDGVLPHLWLQSADRLVSYGGDPANRPFMITAQLLEAAYQVGAILEIARCTDVNGCTNNNLLTYTVDLAQYGPFSVPRQSIEGNLDCDFRFSREVGGDVFDTDFVGSSDRDGVRTILINGVAGNRRWTRNARSALSGVPNRVILDERTGGGGTFEGVSALYEPFVGPAQVGVAYLLPQFRPEAMLADVVSLAGCQDQGGDVCGNFFYLSMLQGVTTRGLQPDARIAIVNGQDVSGNDYLPHALINRPTGQTRVFGPGPTYGAFGPIYTLPRLASELYGGSSQVHDTLFDFGSGPNPANFMTGNGVLPDDRVLQRQSDAISGVDTLMEAARTWVLGGP